MKNLIEYTPVLLAAALLAAGVYSLVNRRKLSKFLSRPKTKERIASLCRMAEEYITGTKQGAKRLEFVCERLWEILPKPLQKYASAADLAETVNYIFSQIAVCTPEGATVAGEEGKNGVLHP